MKILKILYNSFVIIIVLLAFYTLVTKDKTIIPENTKFLEGDINNIIPFIGVNVKYIINNSDLASSWKIGEELLYIKEFQDGRIRISEPEVCEERLAMGDSCTKIWYVLKENETITVITSGE